MKICLDAGHYGAFRNKTYAQNFLKEVQKTFPDAFIKTSVE